MKRQMNLENITRRAPLTINFALSGASFFSVIGILLMLFHLYPANPNAEPIELKIHRGMRAKAIADLLEKKKLIRSSLAFQLVGCLTGTIRKLQGGTYRLSGAVSTPEIIHQLKTGKVVMRRLTAPEGMTIAQIDELWANNNFGDAGAFIEAARSSNLSRAKLRERQARYGIEGETLEGYLFPNTYQFPDGAPPDQVIEMMLDEFNRQWTHELDEEAKLLGWSTHEIITLASIIEKETKVDEERPLISAVFHNRMHRGWRLEADATALYALGNPGRPPNAADLKVDSPYNTYLYNGLPPGPICNPGLASILAALRPASAGYLYFVALGDGRHHFSATIEEHQRMIRKIYKQQG
jgi:UPF0755 protein